MPGDPWGAGNPWGPQGASTEPWGTPYDPLQGHVRTWANAEKEWKTLQEILQGDAEDRRRILYFRDVAVGWMEATDTDVLSTVRDNEFMFPERDASGRLMNRRRCPNPPERFEWQATLEVANPRKRMQHPPDITDLAARPPPEHNSITQPPAVQPTVSSVKGLLHPRYTNVAEPSDEDKVKVLRVKKSELVRKRPSSSSKEEPFPKKQCASGNVGTTITLEKKNTRNEDTDQKMTAPEEPLPKKSIAFGASSEYLPMKGSSSAVDPFLKHSLPHDVSFENRQCAGDNASAWLCIACMLKLGVLKKRLENNEKHM